MKVIIAGSIRGRTDGFKNQLFGSAMTWGADYFGVADFTPARETIFEQGSHFEQANHRQLFLMQANVTDTFLK